MVRPTVNSTKHYVQYSLATTTVGTVTSIELIDAKQLSAVSTGATDVRTGSVIKAVFIELWLRGQDTSAGSFVCTIGKNSVNSTGPTAAEMANLMDYNEKNNLFFVSQGLINDSLTAATPVYRGWMKIPKGKQRFGLGESLNINILAQALDVNHCGMSTYKEYY